MAAAAMLFVGVLWSVLQQEDPSAKKIRALIDNLRSKEEIDRDYGLFELKNLGRTAEAELKKATLDKDPEVAKQARLLLRRLDVLDVLTPKLRRVAPGVEDQLAESDEAWLMVLRRGVELITLSEAKHEKPPLEKEDLEALAAPAVRGAVTNLQKQEACLLVLQYQLKSGTAETSKLLKDEALMKAMAPILRTNCMNHLQELWRHQAAYAKQFGRMPKETGPEFWQALTKSQPPILEPSSKFLGCPAQFLAGGTRPYWGPKGDVETYAEGSAVGLCDDPLHGSYANILLKSGDLMSWLRTAPMTTGAKAQLKGP